jgi:hypothetical protein
MQDLEQKIQAAFTGPDGPMILNAYHRGNYDEMRTIAAASVKGMEELIGMDLEGDDSVSLSAGDELIGADQHQLRQMKAVEAEMQGIH